MVEARQVDKWEGQPDREVVGDPLKGEAFLEEGARGGGGPLPAPPDRLVALGGGPGHAGVRLHAPGALGVGGAALTAVLPATFEQGHPGGHQSGPKVSHFHVKSNAAPGVV